MSPASPVSGLLVSRDLFFTSKVTGTAGQLGYVVQVVPDLAAAAARIAEAEVRCVFLDLASPISGLAEFVAALPADRRPTLVAFGSHVATAQLQAARDAGCDAVLPRSRFSGELPNLLREYLGGK
jgi:CheY-like chemotaxis protein